ncbi:type IV pilus assembly protein PilM [bacterium]|nr:type IV pilus assembly protein PilM [bacterium]
MASSLVGLFKSNASLQLGIDVGASAVKVVALERSGKGYRLMGLGWEETPPGAVVDGSLSDTKTIAQVVTAALKQTKLNYKGASAAVGLRGINVVFKRISIPFQGIAELGKQVVLEAQQHVDSDLSNWEIDYEPIGEPTTEGQIAILLVAARKSVVEQYVEMLKQVGVRPAVLDCDAFAMSNSLELIIPDDSKTLLCIDVGRDSTKIHLTIRGQTSIIRSLPIGGAHFTDLLSRQLGINHVEAETLKWSIGNPDFAQSHPEIAEICKQHTFELCEEIKKTMEFYAGMETSAAIRDIDAIVLSGGGSVVPGLSEGISTLMNADTVYASPFRGMELTSKEQETVTSRYSHQFAVATGLALRREGDKE